MHTPDLDPMLGRTIRDFRIEKKLAHGGMGAVYLARHVLLASTLKVIKVLLPAYASHPELRQRFHREAEAASKLKHDCVLGIDNFGTLDDGQLFIVAPYLEGQPLDSYLRSRGSLAPHRALHLVVQLCDALDHAHSLGIIHRDLKPGNVFLMATNTNPYALKLLDFGIVKLVDKDTPQTRSGIALGTPSYMAVEQYEHADRVTHLADVYSLAIMIWEMVTGRLPWRHPDQAVLYHQQRTMIPERPPESEMPSQWADLLLSALSVDPASRPQSARELAFGLASALPAVGGMPSGAEILAGLAPHFMCNAAPSYDTVRNVSDVDRIGPLLWPPRATASAPRREATTPALAMEAVANGHSESALTPSTSSVTTGVVVYSGGRHSLRWKLTLAIGTAAVAAVVAGIAATASSSGGSASESPSAPLASPPNHGRESIDRGATAPAAVSRDPAVPAGAEATPAAEPMHYPTHSTPSDTRTPNASNQQGNQRAGLPSVKSPVQAPTSARPNSATASGAPRMEPATSLDPDDIYGPEK